MRVSRGRPTSERKWNLLVPCTIDHCTAVDPCRRWCRTIFPAAYFCASLRSAVCWETSSCRWTPARNIWSDHTRLRKKNLRVTQHISNNNNILYILGRWNLTFITVGSGESGKTEASISTTRQRLARGPEAARLGRTGNVVVARVTCVGHKHTSIVL